ncbi:MAG: membrane dipeptidase [Oscillospiraceae bacterium]|nr:membrane dipeptidase [Oscillospiraceae bacterium]
MKHIRYFDGHCDTIYRCYVTGEGMRSNGGHIALDRIDGFDSYAQMFTFFWDADEAPARGMLAVAKEMYVLFQNQLQLNSDCLIHCRSTADVLKCAGKGKVCALLSVEGADLLDCDPDNIELAQQWGVKLINPTWNCSNALSGSHCRDNHRGLSDVGRAFVKQAEQANILMDVSHLSQKGFWDLVEMTSRPIVASHSNSRSVYEHSRGLTDDQFRAVCETGGVVGLNFYSGFVGTHPTMDMLIRHLEHFLELGGEKHVAIGGDLDGCDETVIGINGVQDVPKLWMDLKEKGYSDQLLDDLFWNNWLRLF